MSSSRTKRRKVNAKVQELMQGIESSIPVNENVQINSSIENPVESVAVVSFDSPYIEDESVHYFTDSDQSSSSEEPEQDIIPLGQELAQWCSRNNITHSATTELLKILKGRSTLELSDLPICARTLLATPRCSMIVSKREVNTDILV